LNITVTASTAAHANTIHTVVRARLAVAGPLSPGGVSLRAVRQVGRVAVSVVTLGDRLLDLRYVPVDRPWHGQRINDRRRGHKRVIVRGHDRVPFDRRNLG